MHQINISDETYKKVQRIADIRQTSMSDVVETLVAEEAAMNAQLTDQLVALLAERSASAAAGNSKPLAEVLDRLSAKYDGMKGSANEAD